MLQHNPSAARTYIAGAINKGARALDHRADARDQRMRREWHRNHFIYTDHARCFEKRSGRSSRGQNDGSLARHEVVAASNLLCEVQAGDARKISRHDDDPRPMLIHHFAELNFNASMHHVALSSAPQDIAYHGAHVTRRVCNKYAR